MESLTIAGVNVNPYTLHDDLLTLSYGPEANLDTVEISRSYSRKEAQWAVDLSKKTLSSVFSLSTSALSYTEEYNEHGYIFEQEFGDQALVTKTLSHTALLLEVAGPTTYAGRTLDDFYSAHPNIIGNRLTMSENPDFEQSNAPYVQMDAVKLPFENSQFGAVFISCLPGAMRNRNNNGTERLRDQALNEAHRVLGENGLLIWAGGTQADLRAIKGLKMEPVHLTLSNGYYRDTDRKKPRFYIDQPFVQGAFQK